MTGVREGTRDIPLVPSAGFQTNTGNGMACEPAQQLCPTLSVIANGETLTQRMKMDVEPGLAHVDADKDGVLWHAPVPWLVRAGSQPLATVRAPGRADGASLALGVKPTAGSIRPHARQHGSAAAPPCWPLLLQLSQTSWVRMRRCSSSGMA